VVPHLETTAASSSRDSAGPAFIVGLLGVDVKRGSNRGNNKKSHCSCHGGGTSLAFIVGLLAVGKEGEQQGQQGNITRLQQGPIVIVAVAGWQRWRRRTSLLSVCLV